MTGRRAFTRALAFGSLAAPAISRAFAQDRAYPDRVIQLVVGFPAGQASDIGARVIAKRMSEELKQSVYVDNKGGAAGIIAHQFVKNAPPDGYTLLFGSTGTLAINPNLYRKLPYDPLKDFVPVVLLNSSPMFLVASNDTRVSSLQEMIAYVKANPGKVSYGSSGNGVTNHIGMEMLKRATGLDMLHVPYKGAAPMVTDLMAGRVQFAFEVSSAILPYAKAGSVRLLGVGSTERSATTPDVPTLAEQGLAGFEVGTWGGLLVPAGTPRPIVERINAATNRSLQAPEVIDHYAKIGSSIKGGSAAAFAEFMKHEVDKWGAAVIASGAQVD